MQPKILINIKDEPDINSGYGIIGRHWIPRLADHYGSDRIIVYAPVYHQQKVTEWKGMTMVGGSEFGYGEGLIEQHYRNYDCNLLIQVGDAWPLGVLPDLALANKVMWVHWLPVDWLGMPDNIKNRILPAHKLVPFSDYGHRALERAQMPNIGPRIWLGLDLDVWKPQDRSELPGIMRSLGFSEDTFNVLVVGANQQRKCIREALEAIALLRATSPDIPVRLYLHSQKTGDRDLSADLSELRLRELTMTPEPYIMTQGGYVEQDMARIFNCADVVINVAMEGFGLAHTQAQACGVAVIHMCEGAGPELVKYGYEVPVAGQQTTAHQMSQPFPSPVGVCAALEDCWRKRQKLGHPDRSQYAIDWTRSNFGWDKIARQWIDVIDQCMDDRQRFCMDIPHDDDNPELWERSGEILSWMSVEEEQ